MNRSSSKTPIIWQIGGFLASLLIGLGIGLLLLTIVWVIWKLAPGQMVGFLGITDQTPWYLSRATGTVAYLLLFMATAWGLLVTTKMVKTAVPAPLTLTMHNSLSWLAVGLTFVHIGSLLFDHYYLYTLADIFVPFIGPYRPGWVALGVVGFYLIIMASVTFYLRPWIGYRWFRKLHYSTYLAYLLVTVHGLMAGTDSSGMGMRLMFGGSAVVILLLTIYRVMNKDTNMRPQRSSTA